MPKKFTPLGFSNFKSIIDENRYYVDKTMLVKSVLEGNQINLWCRPRRFGKTLNMDMLKCFFSNSGDHRVLFDGLEITKDAASMAHLGQYPVVFFSLKDIKSNHWSEALISLQIVLQRLWNDHKSDFKGTAFEEQFAQKLQQLELSNPSPAFLAASLHLLCSLLYERYQQQVIILIDEYDAPVQAAFLNGYYEEMVSFLKKMLGAALKDNPHLKKGILTGILRVAKESMFSDLNNFITSTSLDNDHFSDAFGFTAPEVRQLLEYYELETSSFDDILEWYDGYRFGRYQIFNPWSVLNYIFSLDHTPEAYWVNTSDDQLLQQLFLGKDANIKDFMESLLDGQKVTIQLSKNLIFQDIATDPQAVWTLLVFSGYLRTENAQFNDTYEVSIPNKEVRWAFVKATNRWLQNDVRADRRTAMIDALVSGQIKPFEKYLAEFVQQVFSYHDTQQRYVENFYHAFFLGLLTSLEQDYVLRSNREAGYGRYDICLVPRKNTKKGIIIEIKAPESTSNETIDDALSAALKQIKEKKYEADLLGAGITDILRLAIAVEGKVVQVREG